MSGSAIPYFISCQILGSFVFLNLVVAIILENFTSLGKENPKLVTGNDVERFKEVWAEFDPDADNYIPARTAAPRPTATKAKARRRPIRPLLLGRSGGGGRGSPFF